MLVVFQLVMGVLLIFSFIGYMQFVRKALSVRWEFIPVFVFSSIACLVFLSGLAGQLYIGSLVLLIVGLLLYGRMVFLGMRRGASFRISFSLFQFSFLAGTFIFLLVLFQNQY